MKIYLAGPMRGIPEFNHPAFHQATAELRAVGYEVFSPAEHDEQLGLNTTAMTGHQHEHETTHPLRKLLGDDLTWICAHADAIAVLPGWEHSLGAQAEVATAKALNLPIIHVNQLTTPRGPPQPPQTRPNPLEVPRTTPDPRKPPRTS